MKLRLTLKIQFCSDFVPQDGHFFFQHGVSKHNKITEDDDSDYPQHRIQEKVHDVKNLQLMNNVK